jgi:hypothetical protein
MSRRDDWARIEADQCLLMRTADIDRRSNRVGGCRIEILSTQPDPGYTAPFAISSITAASWGNSFDRRFGRNRDRKFNPPFRR